MLKYLSLLGIFVFCPAVSLGQFTWNNAAGGNFLTPGNWTGNATPGANDTAQILIGVSSPITLSSGTTSINGLVLNNASATMSQSSGSTLSIGGNGGTFTFTAGTYNLTNFGTTLNLLNGMTMNGGTFNQNPFTIVNLTGTMNLNGGVYNFVGGSINGGTVTGGGNRLKFNDGTLNGVAIGLNTMDTSSGTIRLTGGTTFAATSAYTLGTGVSVFVGTGQSGISNVAWTMGNSSTFYGSVNGDTWTFGSSGTGSPAVTYGGSLSSNIASTVANNSVIIDGIAENTGSGTFSIRVTGSATNSANGTLRATAGRLEFSPDTNAINNGAIVSNGGTVLIAPGGTFSNTSSITATTGTVTIQSTGNASTSGTILASSGIVNVNPTGTFSNTGTITIQAAGTVNLRSSIAPADLGTVSRATPNTGLLNLIGTMTLPSNTDIAGLGTITLRDGGTITSASTATLSSTNPAAQIKVASFTSGGTLNNINIAAGMLNFTNSNEILRITGGTTFAAGSSYTLGTSTSIFIGQTSFSNVSWDLGSGGSIQAVIPGQTMTIGSSGTGVPAIRNTGSVTTTVTSDGPNGHIINNHLIENAGTGILGINPAGNFINNGTINTTAGNMVISPTGTFTNNGILSSNSGAIFVQVSGANFITGPGSQIVVTGSGSVQLPASSTNSATVTITAGTANVSTTTNATYTNSGSTTVSPTSSFNVGNQTASAVINSGTFGVGTTVTPGGTLTVGTTSNIGVFTNNGGTYTLNGTAYARTTVNGGTLTGGGTINGTTTTGLVIGAGGTLSPGNSPGIITIGGKLEIGGNLEYDITNPNTNPGFNNSNVSGPSQTPGTGFDTIIIQPPPATPTAPTNATINTTATNIRLRTANTSQTLFNSDTFWSTTQIWALARTTNTNTGVIELRDGNNNLLTGQVPAQVRVFNSDGQLEFSTTIQYPNGNFYYLVGNASDANFTRQLDLVWTPVPEPVSTLGLCTLVLSWGCWRKRRSRM